MKVIFVLVLATIAGQSMAGECIKTDYQELKELSDQDLVKKYCQHVVVNKDETIMAEFMTKMSSSYNDFKDSKEAIRTARRASESTASAELCKSEMERTARILAQRSISEAQIADQCSTLKSQHQQ